MLTLMTATGCLLWLMFAVGDANIRKDAMFGTFFFEATESPSGAVLVDMGVANPTGLVVIFVVYALLLAVIQLIYRRLKVYRAALIEQRRRDGATLDTGEQSRI